MQDTTLLKMRLEDVEKAKIALEKLMKMANVKLLENSTDELSKNLKIIISNFNMEINDLKGKIK